MPLFGGLIKRKQKKTKDQPTTAAAADNIDKTSTTSTGGSSFVVAKTASNATTSSASKKVDKTKSEQSQLSPVRTISHKTPNPFTAPVNIPKSPTTATTTTAPAAVGSLAAPPPDLDSSRMYSSSPGNPTAPSPPSTQHQPSSPHQQPPQRVHNVVTGQYNAPPTPPSTARSGSIDDKLDLSVSSNHQPSYDSDHLTHPQPQQGYHQSPGIPSSDAVIGSQSGLLTPVQSGSDCMPSSTRYTPTQEATAPTVRQTKGKYSINDFSIQRTLGTGSFGRVHLVQSRHNHRFYAIKVLKKNQVVKMKQVEHTNDERAMLQLVRHPFLVNLWGTFQDSKNLYMVMDFIEGGELFSLLRKSQRFPNAVAKFYAAEVVLAINYLHTLDIIYRDLKPENLLLDRHGHIKITDFGFAKNVPDITWTLCGTPDYLAPEVVASKGYNKSVDWWSLGILTFEMLAGYPPFYDQNPMKLYENIMNGRIKYPSYFETLARDLLSKLLTADLSKRFGNLKGGSADIVEHAWFAEVNWERLERREIDAPYVPPIRPGGGDASQFERYDEETEEYGDFTSKDVYGHLFGDF